MPQFEYKVIPAPRRGEKTRGAKTPAERFAQALTTVMNSLGREGWEYLRADTLPCEERTGLTGKTTNFQNMLVFRRVLSADAPQAVLPEPAPEPRPQLTAYAPEGQAPRLTLAAEEPATPPSIGPARGNGMAAG
jgi:hypothetical protein